MQPNMQIVVVNDTLNEATTQVLSSCPTTGTSSAPQSMQATDRLGLGSIRGSEANLFETHLPNNLDSCASLPIHNKQKQDEEEKKPSA